MRHALVGLFLLACSAPSRAPGSLTTTGERSGYVRTGRYDEAVRLCGDFARAYHGVRCVEIGRSIEDRPIVALRVERRPRLPVIYVEAGIHAGEIEGKDAGFAVLRDLLDGKVAPGALDRVAIVFVPVLNPDGLLLARPTRTRFAWRRSPCSSEPAEVCAACASESACRPDIAAASVCTEANKSMPTCESRA